MRKLRVLVAVLLGFCWIPASSYCFLERVNVVQCGGCCSGESDDCCGSGCASLCSAPASTVPKTLASAEKVASIMVPTIQMPQGEIIAAGDVLFERLPESPPGSFTLAEFLGRTSTPARAPAII